MKNKNLHNKYIKHLDSTAVTISQHYMHTAVLLK